VQRNPSGEKIEVIPMELLNNQFRKLQATYIFIYILARKMQDEGGQHNLGGWTLAPKMDMFV
jgi:hypothetical protein